MRGLAFHHHADLAAAARAAVAASREKGRPQWVSVSEPLDAVDALDVFASADGAERFFWEVPARREQVAALGVVAELLVEGEDRFDEAARRARRLRDDLHVAAPSAEAGRAPILVGGFAFRDEAQGGVWQDFPAGRLVLPATVVHRSGNTATLTVHHAVAAGDDPGQVVESVRRQLRKQPLRHVTASSAGSDAGPPTFEASADAPHEQFRSGVSEALQAVARGDLEKVVLARSVRVHRPDGYRPASILAALRRAHPSCATFAVARGDQTFLGATPERLLELDGRRIETAAVAGSAPRGRSPEEDARHARELCESKKEQAEHGVVVRALREVLAQVCSRLDVSEAPRLLRLEGIQHLETPVSGILSEEMSLLELAGRLHPTPAVGGAPCEAALEWLREHESLARGWYAGPVGVVRRDGGGELWVALRSALLHRRDAHLFVGAGIVAGADPQAELRETQLKLRAMLDALVDL